MKTALIKTRFFRLCGPAVCLVVFAVAQVALADSELWVGKPGVTATTNWSDPNNWSGASQNPNDNTVYFGNANSVGLVTNNVVDKSTNCYSLNYTNSTGYNTTLIAPGQTLTIDGNNGGPALVMIPGHQAANTNLITGGNGTLLITGASAGGVAVSVTNSSAIGVAPILDMSGLGMFMISNADSSAAMEVGAGYNGTGSASAGGILKLAATNYLSLPAPGTGASAALLVGYNNVDNGSTPGGIVYLGQSNSIFADNIGVGLAKQSAATIAFNPVFTNNNPSAVIGGYSGAAVKSWAIGDGLNTSASTNTSGTVDFDFGTVNAVVNAMWLGKPSTGSSGNPPATGTLSFSAGTISVNALTNGCAYAPGSGAGPGVATGTITVTGTGTLSVNTMVLAFLASGARSATGKLNITNGTVAAGTIIAGAGQSTINLNGGTLIVTNTAGTTAAPLTTFDLNGGGLNGGNVHLDVNGAANVTNIVATTIFNNVPTQTGITIDSLNNVVVGGIYPLIAYLSGSSDPFIYLRLGLPGNYSGYLADMTHSNLVALVITAVPPVFSGLTASQSITYGAAGITLSGKVSATGPVYPAMGETIDVTIDGNEQMTTISDATGDFSINYNPSTIPARGTPYTITYAYGGDADLTSASDMSTTLTVNQAVPVFSGLTASQSILYGTAGITLSGKVSATGGLYPAMGETIDVTIDGNEQMTTINDATGDFSFNYNPSTIPARGAPYPITYAYGGDVDFTSTSDASRTLSVNAPPPTLMPAMGAAGSMATVSVSDYAPGETVKVTYNGVMITSFMVSGTGSGSMSFTIPPGQAETYPVMVTGQTSGLTATVYFQQINGPTTIDAVNKYAWGANFGWMDWSGGSGETNDGAIIGQYVCSGYIYSANAGWIYLGSGSPADGIQYQNNSATDFGVNQDGLGNLTGYAYGANIGWLTFEQTYGRPKVNLTTGNFSGYVWSANCGWISLSNAVAYVQTDTISPGAPGLPTVSVNPATVCAGSSTMLTATINNWNTPTYSWSPGGATTASIIVSPASTTTYTVTVTDSTTHAVRSASGTVTVNPLPTVSVNSPTIDAGTSTTLTATTSASSPSYSWNPGGATTASIMVSPTSTTMYTVTVTDGTTGCANSGSGTVTVVPPRITTGGSLPNAWANMGYNQTLAATGCGSSFTWSIISGSLPAGLILNPATGTISGVPTTMGKASFTVQATDQCGQTATEVFTLTVLHATTIDIVNRYAWGANFGWMDWRGDTLHGVVVTSNVLSGYIYSANVGWICLGSGFPANGIQYQNNAVSDFGVNMDRSGNLTGYGYGANIGWLSFEQTYGQPKVNLTTGDFGGYVWSANGGWISLSNAEAYVQTSLSLIVSGPGAFTSAPGITNFYLMNGTNVVMGGTNGQSGDTYYLLQSTNLTLPLPRWNTVGTDVLSGNGPFAMTFTNVVKRWPQQFYILSSTNFNP